MAAQSVWAWWKSRTSFPAEQPHSLSLSRSEFCSIMVYWVWSSEAKSIFIKINKFKLIISNYVVSISNRLLWSSTWIIDLTNSITWTIPIKKKNGEWVFNWPITRLSPELQQLQRRSLNFACSKCDIPIKPGVQNAISQWNQADVILTNLQFSKCEVASDRTRVRSATVASVELGIC